MRIWLIATAFALVGVCSLFARPKSDLPPVVDRAMSSDADTSQNAIEQLRRGGRESLDRLLQVREQLAAEGDAQDPRLARLDAAIDRVGGQRYCRVSRLFWHTDFAQAQAEARQSGKPILSLRLLGNLTDEFSCANSRFFRTTLYANEQISTYMRENFVLHWKSVRPVPTVTVDFGDGRKLRRTLTGNSIHYLLTADGQPIDALPGLYGSHAFLEWLQRVHWVERRYSSADADSRHQVLSAYHQLRAQQIAQSWREDLEKIGVSPGIADNDSTKLARLDETTSSNPPPAEAAARLAAPKALVEAKLIPHVTLNNEAAQERLESSTDEAAWEQIAALHRGAAEFDDASIDLIKSENPSAADAAPVAITKLKVEAPLVRMLSSLRNSIALDTVKNEYLLHREIHEWFVEGAASSDIDELNERVYAELFLTPSSDPWLGLMSPDTYAALDNNGVVEDTFD